MAMYARWISIGLCLSSAISQSLGSEPCIEAVCMDNAAAPSSVLLQKKSRVSRKSVVTEVEHSMRADPQYNLMADAVSGASKPANIMGTRGALCSPSASTALVFAGARVTSNNLGGKGPNIGDPQELRYTGVGTKNGQGLDLVVTADNPSAYIPKGNGEINGLNGQLGTVSVWAGTSADLTFKIEESLSKAPVVLDEFYVSILDIDAEQARIRERVYVTYDSKLVDRVLEPTNRGMTEVELLDGRTVYESTIAGGPWNNPTDPMKLGVVANPSSNGVRSVNQRNQALMFIFRKTSSWKLTFEATHTEGLPHGRNFVFGGTSAIIDICPGKQKPGL